MLDMDRIRVLGETRARARAEADRALTEAFDAIQAAYEAGGRVNVKQAAELLGLTRQQIYTELDRRGVERLRAA
jgi:predicted HTH domain antitoxin